MVTGTLALLSVGCGSSTKLKPEEKQVYRTAFRQLPPQPVYNRTRFVHLPEMAPSRELPKSSGSAIIPVVHLELKNATLDEASSVLAAISQYSSYCASTVAKKRVTVNTLGTLQELADEISNKTGATVIIDHQNRQVRVISGDLIGDDSTEATTPQFLPTQETQENNVKSAS